MTNTNFVKKCINEKTLRSPQFWESLINMRFDILSQEDIEFFVSDYFFMKGDSFLTAIRTAILSALVLQCKHRKYNLKEFFLTAFNKERNLEARLIAIRGFSEFATEAEIIPLMNKFSTLLSKEGDYRKLEVIRSEFGIPYLVSQYGYECFKKTMKQLETHYNNYHDELKGFFTLDANGIQINLLTKDEINKRFESFFKRVNNK